MKCLFQSGYGGFYKYLKEDHTCRCGAPRWGMSPDPAVWQEPPLLSALLDTSPRHRHSLLCALEFPPRLFSLELIHTAALCSAVVWTVFPWEQKATSRKQKFNTISGFWRNISKRLYTAYEVIVAVVKGKQEQCRVCVWATNIVSGNTSALEWMWGQRARL